MHEDRLTHWFCRLVTLSAFWWSLKSHPKYSEEVIYFECCEVKNGSKFLTIAGTNRYLVFYFPILLMAYEHCKTKNIVRIAKSELLQRLCIRSNAALKPSRMYFLYFLVIHGHSDRNWVRVREGGLTSWRNYENVGYSFWKAPSRETMYSDWGSGNSKKKLT